MAPPRRPIKERLMERIAEIDGCWIWQGSRHRDGYGSITIGRRVFRVHRVAFETYVGPIGDGLLVCHRCDVPLCVNPEHLFLGTHRQNTADMLRKKRNRAATVTTHPLYKIGTRDRRIIRNRRAQGETLSSIAADYGVKFQTIGDICRGRRNYAAA